MNIPAASQSLEEVLTRRASIVDLLADTDAELLERYGWIPPVNGCTCGHPNSTPAIGSPESWECSACALKRVRAEEEARKARALKDEPDPADWGDTVLPFVRKAMWPS